MDEIIGSLRVRQWVKNVVVFAPLVFSARLLEPLAFLGTLIAFVCFCLASSSVYLFNDILDRRLDRFHPRKKHRPIASGALPIRAAWTLAMLLLGGSLIAAVRFHAGLAMWVLVYVLVNVAYSMALKRFVILDVILLSTGFVIRIWGGAAVLGMVPSHWLQLSMFFLALFLSLAKRRQELVILHARALRHRKVLSDYSPAFIDQLTSILTAVAILCYALYAVSPEVTGRLGQEGFIYTVPVVIYTIFRYL
jgi:4-hydroxybenzoate polyprenyltransferase